MVPTGHNRTRPSQEGSNSDVSTPSALTLRDIFTIPEHTGTDDYVLRLSSSVTADHMAQTIADYVLTPELIEAFEQALSLISDAQRSGNNRAAFLEGSFGSGKSHFMAVLHAILARHPAIRDKQELQPVLARHGYLDGQNILRLTFHFLDSDTIEATLFAQYLDQIAILRPDAPRPVLHSAGGLFDDAENLRATIGDESFFVSLQTQSAPSDSLFGRLGVAPQAWTLQRYLAAIDPVAPLAERTELQQALIASHFKSYSRNTDWLSLEDGLEVIAVHAKSLGYDGVLLLLDELILWLTFIITEHTRLNGEVQKITKLVESGRGTLAVPITSFVARQHDLRRWLDHAGGLGAEQDALERALQHQSGRFSTIRLGDENLPFIAHQRLLLPRNDAAAQALDTAFARLDRNPRVWDVLRNGINLFEDQRAADTEAFRLTYPFSPALIDTLKSLAGLMQRERTALKVMQKMLLDHADDLTIDNVIPVGDAFDDLIDGTAGTSSSDPRVGEKFKQAKDLWRNKLRPYILSKDGIVGDVADSELKQSVRSEVRLAKTVVLAALAPNVPALKQLDATRLASLNHGSIREVLPGDAPTQALRRVTSWVAAVPEVKVGAGTDPVIAVTLADVDFQSVVERARNEDNEGRRRDLFKQLLFEELGIDQDGQQINGVITEQIVWRGTRRDVDWLFGNVRDRSHLPDEKFEARPGSVQMILDYPFDDKGKSGADDHDRLARWKQDHPGEHFTLVWLPAFLTDEENSHLGTLVKLNAVLKGENWKRYAEDLSPTDQPVARNILESQQDSLRRQFGAWIQQVYGAAAGRTFVDSEPPLVSLHAAFDPRKPVGSDLREAAERLAAGMFDTAYPNHPEFTPAGEALTEHQLNKVLAHLREADAHPDHRVALDRDQRDLTRRVVMPLELAKVNETHLIFGSTEFSTWDSRITQELSRGGHDLNGPINVEVLRRAVNPSTSGRGLSDNVRDLVVAAWAMLHRRSWSMGGSTVVEPQSLREIRADQELITQRLPDRQLFAEAVRRYQLWLGGTQANTHLTAANLATFAEAAMADFRQATEIQRELVKALSAAYAAVELESGDRAMLAGELVALGTHLGRSSDKVTFVETLAGAEMSATDTEIGAGYGQAAAVREAVTAITWARYDNMVKRPDLNEVGKDILLEVRNILASSQFSLHLEPALARNDSRRQDWLESLGPPPIPPKPPIRRPPPVGRPAGPATIDLHAGAGVAADDIGAIRDSLTGALEQFLGLRFIVTVEASSDVDD